MRFAKYFPLVPALALALLLIGPAIGVINAVGARHIMLIAILALMVSGVNLVLGYAGELFVGQVAFYAIGAYLAGFVGMSLGQSDVLLGLLAVILAAVVVGVLTGIPSLRLSGWSLAMVTFFLVLITPDVIQILRRWTGGFEGFAVDRATLFGLELDAYGYYIVVVLVTASWFLVTRNTILSPHGTSFLVLRQSPELASALGLPVYQTKLKVYVLGTIAPTIAGALFAWLDGFVAPDVFTFGLAITLLAASVLGGATSIYGALLGAAVLHLTEDSLAEFNQYQLIAYGLVLAVFAIVLPQGLTGVLRSWLTKLGQRFSGPTRIPETPVEGNNVELEQLHGEAIYVEDVEKHFGGNHALRGVSLTAQPGEITALIGPNGSGKTTLLNVVNGFVRPDSGSVRLGSGETGVELSNKRVHQVSKSGVARTFQTPIMPQGVSTLDFVSLGCYLTDPASLIETVLRLPGHRRRESNSRARAEGLLGSLNLTHLAGQDVDSLPLGTRRLVEVARSLAARPSVLLLDEVGSGLDGVDLERLEELLARIRDAGVTIILVEHNFPLVMRLADRIHVLSRGSTLREGLPAEVRTDENVISEYLGGTPA